MTITKLGDDDVDLLFDDDNNPRATDFGNAVQMWACCQNREHVTIQEAALAFNATPEVICQAVDEHPWMYLDGDKIEHDGE